MGGICMPLIFIKAHMVHSSLPEDPALRELSFHRKNGTCSSRNLPVKRQPWLMYQLTWLLFPLYPS